MAKRNVADDERFSKPVFSVNGKARTAVPVLPDIKAGDTFTAPLPKGRGVKDLQDEILEDKVTVAAAAEEVAPDSAVAASDQPMLMAQAAPLTPGSDPARTEQKVETASGGNSALWWLGGISLAGIGTVVGVSLSSDDNVNRTTTTTVTGKVTDGPIRDALLYIDENHNGVYDVGVDTALLDANGVQVTTGADGTFSFVTNENFQSKQFVAHGGVDTVTGETVTVDYSAPIGYNNLNPITSLIAAYMEANGTTAAQAEAAVVAALGLPDLDYSQIDLADPATSLAAQQAAAILATAAIIAEQSGAGADGFDYLAENMGSGGNTDAVVAALSADPLVAGTDAETQLADTVAAVNSAVDLAAVGDALNNTYFNDPPAFTSAITADVAENSTAVMTVAAADPDPNDQTLTYSITGGADQDKFTIDSSTGALVFASAPDFETPTDADGNNAYVVEVTADDGNKDDGTMAQTITVNVTDAKDAIYHNPEFIADAYKLAATDAEVTDITVISSIAADVSLDVTPNAGSVVTLSDSTISVQANAEMSSAALDIQGAAGTVLKLDVTASGVSTDASATITTGGALEIGEINIEASGNAANSSSDSSVNIIGDVTLGDFITVTASGISAEALFLSISSADGIVFTDNPAGGITVTASGDDAAAVMLVNNASGTVSSIAVEASGVSAGAGVLILPDTTDLNITDSLTLLASGDGSGAVVVLGGGGFGARGIGGGSSDAGPVVFTSSAISVTASGDDSNASMDVNNASGTVSSIAVAASGFSSDAGAYIESDGTLEIGAINIEASGNATSSSDASYAGLDIGGDVTVGSSLTVTASGGSAEASLRTYPGLQQNNAVTLPFTATNASGDVLLAAGDYTLTVGATTVTYTLADNTYDIGVVRNGLSDALDVSDPDADFYLSYFDDQINIVWEDFAPHSDAISISTLIDSVETTYDAVELSAAQAPNMVTFDNTAINVTAGGYDSYAGMDVHDASGIIRGISVTASGNSTSADVVIEDIGTSAVTIMDSVTVIASGESSDAVVELGSSSVAFDAAAISVTASSYDSNANMGVNNASGTVSSIAVEASGGSADAVLFILPDSSDLNITGNVTVLASGDSSDAVVMLGGGGVKAKVISGGSSDAGPVVFTSSAISVTAEGADSEARADINNASGTISSITADASDRFAWAYANVSGTEVSEQTSAVTLPFTATNASGDVLLAADDYTLTVGATTVSYTLTADATNIWDVMIGLNNALNADYPDADFSLYYQNYNQIGIAWNDFATHTEAITISTDAATYDAVELSAAQAPEMVTFDNTVISATSVSYDSGIFVDVYNASGTISSIAVTASDTLSSAALSIDGDDNTSALTITDSVTVIASGGSSDAAVDLGGSGGPKFALAPPDVNGSAAFAFDSATISVTAEGNDSSANMFANNVSGTISSITVTSSGGSADARVSIGSGASDLNITGNMTLLASGDGSGAEVDMLGGGGVKARGIGGSSDAAPVVFTSSAISVTAEGDDSYARTYITNASGAISSLTVETSGESSNAGAYIESDGTLEIGAINIEAGGNATNSRDESIVDVNMRGDVNLGDFITVTASGISAEATFTTSSADAVVFTDVAGSISVTASGYESHASMDVYNASGTISSLTVEASAYDTSSNATVTVSSGDVITLGDNITVTATGDYASASASLGEATGTTALFTNFHFTDGGGYGSNYIEDGGRDVYDDGNYLSSATAISMDYTDTPASGNFGIGSQNVVVYQSGIFGLLVTGNSSPTFNVTGDLGSDGGGYEDLTVVSDVYNGYQAVIHRNYGSGGDPSINQVVIYSANPDVTVEDLADGTSNDDLLVSGLSSVSTFAYFVLYGDNPSAPLDMGALTEFFHSAVDNVLLDGVDIAAMQAAFYNDFSTLSESVTDFVMPAIAFNDTAVNVTASSYDATANLDVYNASGTLAGISVTASEYSTSADAYIDGTVSISGEIVVTASDTDSEANLDLSGVNFNGTAINVTAVSHDSDAYFDTSWGGTGTINGISVTTGILADGTTHVSADYANASVSINGEITISGNVVVEASGVSSEADLTLGSNDSLTFVQASINVTTSGYDSSADVEIYNATGTVSSIMVTASGSSSNAELYFDGESSDAVLQIGSSLSVTASSSDASASIDMDGNHGQGEVYTVTLSYDASIGTADLNGYASGDYTLDVGGDIVVFTLATDTTDMYEIINGLNGKLDVSAGYSLYDYGNGQIAIGWDDFVTHSETITINGEAAALDIPLVMPQMITYNNTAISATADGNGADAHLDLHQSIGTIDGITATAQHESSSVDIWIEGSSDVTVAGAIDIEASGTYSDASLSFDDDSTVSFDNASTSVTASCHDATANLEAYNASGTISSLSVIASGESTDASAYVESDGTLEISAINVEASGNASNNGVSGWSRDWHESYADLFISGDVTLGDSITVTASGRSAEASFSVDSSATVTFTDNADGGITVTASSEDASAQLDVHNASGTISSLTVESSGYSASADAYIDGTVSVSGSVVVTAADTYSEANLDLSGVNFDDASISVTAVSDDANAYLDVWGTGTINGISVTTGISADGSHVSADYAYASASISGDVTVGGNVVIEASGGSSEANLTLGSNDSVAFDSASISVTASGYDSEASADIYNATGTLTGISVTASGYSASADAYIDGTVSISGSVVVTASDTNSEANLDLSGVNFDDASISVTAVSDDANAYLDVWGTGTINGISVTTGISADGSHVAADYAYASASISGDVTVGGNVVIEASGGSSEANLTLGSNDSVAFDSASISVTASGYSSEAWLDAYNASGSISSLTVEASGDNTSADAYIDGTVSISGNIAVTASGYRAEASADIFNSYGTLDSITVTASGEDAYADVNLSHDAYGATLNVVTIDVSASGKSSDANLDLAGFEGRHAQTSVTVPIDGSYFVAAGVYTLTIDDMTATYELLADNTSSTVFRGLQDRLETLYGRDLPVDLIETSDGFARYEWNDYTDHAGELITLTGPGAMDIDGVVTQVAQDQSFINMVDSVINVSATGYSAEASLYIDQATGSISSITVTADASSDSTDAYAEIGGEFSVGNITVQSSGGFAELNLGSSNDSVPVTMDSSNILVTADNAQLGDYSTDATLTAYNVIGTISTLSVAAGQSGEISVDISGNFTLAEDMLTVSAYGEDSSADVSLYGVGYNETDLGDHNVTLTDMGIYVESSGYNSETDLYLADAKGIISTIDVSANNRDAQAGADIDFSGNLAGNITVTATGEDSNANLDMSAGVRTYTEVRWEGLQIWNGSSYVVNPDTQDFLADETYTLTVGDVELSYTLQAGDITASDYTNYNNLIAGLMTDANYADAGFEILHANVGPENRYFNILWDDATSVHNQDVIGMTVTGGSFYGTDTVNLVSQGLNSYSDYTHDGSAITLVAGTDVVVNASGDSSDAWTNLDNLSGTMDTLTVTATGVAVSDTFDHQGSVADAVVRFDSGGVTAVSLDATFVEDEVYAAISQHVKSDTVTVTGDGHATLLFDDQTADNINLSALHEDVWGVFNLELSVADAAYNSLDVDALGSGMITITDFDTTRDSINISTPYDDRTYEWSNDNNGDHARYYVNYSEDVTDAVTYEQFLADAEVALDSDIGDNPDYYFGVVGSYGYLAYDRGGDGITGVIKLDGVTEFDRVNVADRMSVNLTGLTGAINTGYIDGAVTSLQYNTNGDASDRVGSVAFTEQTHIEGLYVSAQSSSDPDAGTYLTLTEGTGGDISFRQADIEVVASAGGYYLGPGSYNYTGADASLDVTGASGTIKNLAVDANGWVGASSSTATFSNFDGAVHAIEIGADSFATSNLTIGGITESVDHLWMSSSTSADATADITLVDGFIVKTDVDMDANMYSDSSAYYQNASVTLEVTQGDHGGDVYASSYIQTDGNTAAAAGTAVFDLTYTDATAENIHLGNTVSGDFVAGSFDGTFNLTLNGADVDTAFDEVNLLHIEGWDSGTVLVAADTTQDDTISFGGGDGQFEINTNTCGSFAGFLVDANTQLDGSTDYYFGVIGDNGYLAYDADGEGITQVVEFLNLTTFDCTRIDGATTVI
jgi:hypothetical protein